MRWRAPKLRRCQLSLRAAAARTASGAAPSSRPAFPCPARASRASASARASSIDQARPFPYGQAGVIRALVGRSGGRSGSRAGDRHAHPAVVADRVGRIRPAEPSRLPPSGARAGRSPSRSPARRRSRADRPNGRACVRRPGGSWLRSSGPRSPGARGRSRTAGRRARGLAPQRARATARGGAGRGAAAVAGEGDRGAEAQGLSRQEVMVTDTDEARRKRSEAARKAAAARSPEVARGGAEGCRGKEPEAGEISLKGAATKGPERRKAAAQKGVASRDPEAQREALRRAAAARSPEERRESGPQGRGREEPGGATGGGPQGPRQPRPRDAPRGHPRGPGGEEPGSEEGERPQGRRDPPAQPRGRQGRGAGS